MTLTNCIMSKKEIFQKYVQEVKQTGIAKRLYSAEDAKQVKKIWIEFIRENFVLVTRIREWEKEYVEAYDKQHKIYRLHEKIEDAMEIAITIYLMNTGGMEIFIFDDENDLSDALWKIENSFAKRVAQLSYDNLLKNIKVKDIFKNF